MRGITPGDLEHRRSMMSAAAQNLLDQGLHKRQHARVYWVPGRIEVSGKHTDYAGGRSLLAAVNKGFVVVSVDRNDQRCRIFTMMGTDGTRLSVDLNVSKDIEPQAGHWSLYPAVAIRRLARNFDIKLGADIAISCDLPEASGMSSSSAVICWTWLVLADRNGIHSTSKFKENLLSPEELYTYLGFIENGQSCSDELPGDRGVGSFGGSEDHVAIMASEPGFLKMYRYCPTVFEGAYSFPSNMAFIIAVSGAKAEKTGDAMEDYNNAAFLARDAATAWCKASGEIPLGGKTFIKGCANLAEVVQHVRQSLGAAGDDDQKVRTAVGEMIAKVDDGTQYGPQGAESAIKYKAGALRTRFEQFFDESEVLTPLLARSFTTKDLEQIGKISAESHRLTVESLGNTIPETAWLPEEARRLGAIGASAFGAGFGGSCWALVESSDAEPFAQRWRDSYMQKFPQWEKSAHFFVTVPGPGAFAM